MLFKPLSMAGINDITDNLIVIYLNS